MKRIVQLFLCVVCVAISTQAYGQGCDAGYGARCIQWRDVTQCQCCDR